MATDELKDDYSGWLHRNSKYSPHLFSNRLDKLFGDAIFSWKSFRFSVILSTVALILTWFGTLFLSPNLAAFSFGSHHGLWLWFCLALAICINYVGDYLSYAQTRLFIKALNASPNTSTKVIFALSDIVAGLGIFVLTFSLFATLALLAVVHGSKNIVPFRTFGVINEAIETHDWKAYEHSHSFSAVAVNGSPPLQSLSMASHEQLETLTLEIFDDALSQDSFYMLFKLQNRVELFKPNYVGVQINDRCALLVPGKWGKPAINDQKLDRQAEIDGKGDYVEDTITLFWPDISPKYDYDAHSNQIDVSRQSVQDILLNGIEAQNSAPSTPTCIPVTDFIFYFDMGSAIPFSDTAEIYQYFVFDTSVFLFRSNYLGYQNFESFDLNKAVPEYLLSTTSKRWGLSHLNAADDEASLETWLAGSFKLKIQENYPDVQIPRSTFAVTALAPSIFFLLSMLLRALSYLTISFEKIAPKLHRKLNVKAYPFIATGLCLSVLICGLSIFL